MPNEGVLVPRGPDPVKLLLDSVPEFRSHLDKGDLELPYVAFGFFAQFLLDLPVGDPTLDRAVAFLNELAESGDPDLDNLIQVSVFESLAGDERSARVKHQLCDKAATLFRTAENMQGTM